MIVPTLNPGRLLLRLRLRDSAWDFFGANFWSRDFLGGFVGSPRDFGGF